MTLIEKIRRIFNSADDKPVTLSAVLMRDDASRLLGDFNEEYLDDCRQLLIVWVDNEGAVGVVSSNSTDGLTAAGMLSIAAGMVNGDE